MPRIHPLELRERVVAAVADGDSHRAAAARFKVSVKFVNDMVKLKRETGALQHRPIVGMKAKGKLEPYKDWLRARVSEQGGLTLTELAGELRKEFGVEVHPWSVGRVLHQLGLSHKKRPFTPANRRVAMCARPAMCG